MTKWTWPLPQDVHSALASDGKALTLDRLLKKIENPALLLQRYTPYPFTEQQPLTRWEWGADQKSMVWNSLLNHMKNLYRDLNGKFWKAFTARQQELAAASLRGGGTLDSFAMKVVWRLPIGLGIPHPLETNIRLHHLYGVPYLPGSALKGVTRAWRLHAIARKFGVPQLGAAEVAKWKNMQRNHGVSSSTPLDLLDALLLYPVSSGSAGDLTNDEKRRIQARYDALVEATQGENARAFFKSCKPPIECSVEIPPLADLVNNYVFDYSRIFGSQQTKGSVVFFDAYPVSLSIGEQSILELDVMTPHHSNYYAKKAEPQDRENPVPVKFPVIAKDTEFLITLGCSSNALLDKSANWVREALQEQGIGAKTRAGYGELVPSDKKTVASSDTSTRSIHDPDLEQAVERWKSKDMGQLDTLAKRIAALDEGARQQELARLLQQKLVKANRWRSKYSDKSWYKTVNSLQHPNNANEDLSDNALQKKEE